MALILKEGKTFKDACGHTNSNAYGVVDIMRCDKAKKLASFVFEIFKSITARENSKLPVARFNYLVSGEAFDEWFSVDALEADDDPYTRAYLYLVQLRDSEDKLAWGDDWVSDEA